MSFPAPPPAGAAPGPVPAQQVAPFFAAAVPTAPVLAIVPPPVPTPARPTPPSGTSAVTSPVEVVEEEEEQEEAPESVSNQAVAYRSPEGGDSLVPYLLGAVLLAALAGASARRPRRAAATAGWRPRPSPPRAGSVAWATCRAVGGRGPGAR